MQQATSLGSRLTNVASLGATPVLALPDDPLKMGRDLYRVLFEPYAKEAYETMNEVESWRRTTDQNALQLRQQIGQ
jgi:hypothetical protein